MYCYVKSMRPYFSAAADFLTQPYYPLILKKEGFVAQKNMLYKGRIPGWRNTWCVASKKNEAQEKDEGIFAPLDSAGNVVFEEVLLQMHNLAVQFPCQAASYCCYHQSNNSLIYMCLNLVVGAVY